MSTSRSTKGELCLVVGHTGAGKSTLLGTVNGLVPHFTGGTLYGTVTVDGRDTRGVVTAGAVGAGNGAGVVVPAVADPGRLVVAGGRTAVHTLRVVAEGRIRGWAARDRRRLELVRVREPARAAARRPRTGAGQRGGGEVALGAAATGLGHEDGGAGGGRLAEDDEDTSPWPISPLIGEASGPLIYFPMRWSMAEEVSAYAATVAESMG